MILKEIFNDVYYVGVNDRTTQRFEGLWPLPLGVSYNSYIIKSDKNVLIDTVEKSESESLKSKLDKVLEDKPLDYLVVNHMEPDHSGSIVDIVRHYPNIKIIGNAITVQMIKGFYGLNDDNLYYVVKDGDTISLGSKTLRFVITPMVHWPETMMTYIEDDKILFSGDAFGTFGALNGAVFDYDMNTEPYFREMYRYYSNIVGKYGKHVQRALAKAGSLKINYICSTHGPIWHDEIAKVVEMTDRFSRYEAEDGVVIVYGSMYGNTAKYAELAATRLVENGVKNIKVYNATYSELSDILADIFRYKGLIIGCPTYSMEIFPPVEALMKAIETRELQNRSLAIFGSFTWASAAKRKLTEYAERIKIPVLASVEIKQAGSELNEAEIRNLADIVAQSIKE